MKNLFFLTRKSSLGGYRILLYILLLFFIFCLWQLFFSNIMFCLEEPRSFWDISINIQTTPKNFSKILDNSLLIGSLNYGTWYGMIAGLYVSQNRGGANMFVKTTLVTTGIITGTTLTIAANLIGKNKTRKQSLANINIDLRNMSNTRVSNSEVLSNINQTTSSTIETISKINDIDKNININSPL